MKAVETSRMAKMQLQGGRAQQTKRSLEPRRRKKSKMRKGGK